MEQDVAYTPDGPVRSTETMTPQALFDAGKRRIIEHYRAHGIDARLIQTFERWDSIVSGARALTDTRTA